jgi:TRAP-type C4-dicarboxylate transport system permease small subunit
MEWLSKTWGGMLVLSVSLCSAMILAIAAIATYEVIARWVFDAPTIWAQEIAVYLLLACAFFGFAPTMHAGEHIRIDLLVRRLKPGARLAVELLAFICIGLYAGVAAWGGCEMAAQSFEYGRKSLTLLSVPVWIPQLVVPIGMTMLLMVALVRSWQLVEQLRGGAAK